MRVRFAVIIMLSMLVITALASPVTAQVADTGCDPEYMDALEARSWWLGTRRVAMNNNLILKPDSVIEYSCLNEAMEVMVAAPYRRLASRQYHDQTLTNMHMLFSESTYWGPITGFSEFSTDEAMQTMVVNAMINYLDASYMHYYLSARVTSGPAGPPATYGIYDCISLSFIWHIARCLEFMDESDLDGFFDFPHYVGFDPRQLPPDFGTCPIDAGARMAHLLEAYNQGANYRLYNVLDDTSPILDGTLYQEDPIIVRAHLDRMLPASCSNSPLIPTGITIERQDAAGTYPEFFCVLPGCSYNNTASRCEE